jgi:hypothetical protein
MFAGGNAVVKWQLATYPLGEVAFGRTLFAFLTVAANVLPRAGWGVLRTRRYREHLQRGLSQFGSVLCWFFTVSVLSLGSAALRRFLALPGTKSYLIHADEGGSLRRIAHKPDLFSLHSQRLQDFRARSVPARSRGGPTVRG